MLEVSAADFESQVSPQLLQWYDEADLEDATLEDLIQAVVNLPGARLVLYFQPGGAWSLSIEPVRPRAPRNHVRLERRIMGRSAPPRERRVSVGGLSASLAPVLDVSDDGSGIAIDCDANELRALLMEGALREPGAHPMAIRVVRVQPLPGGRFRVGCVVGDGQETARELLS